MRLSELVRLACSLRDENEMEADPEVFVVNDEDGFLHDDFEVEYMPEQFDGFDTAYPACIILRIENENVQ